MDCRVVEMICRLQILLTEPHSRQIGADDELYEEVPEKETLTLVV